MFKMYEDDIGAYYINESRKKVFAYYVATLIMVYLGCFVITEKLTITEEHSSLSDNRNWVVWALDGKYKVLRIHPIRLLILFLLNDYTRAVITFPFRLIINLIKAIIDTIKGY